MKTILSIITILSLFISCSPKIKTPQSELEKFSHRNDTIFYLQEPIAKIYNLEYEHYRGHRTLEISIETFRPMDANTDPLIDWILMKKKNAKVEIRQPIQFF
jgi:hypothetical protein